MQKNSKIYVAGHRGMVGSRRETGICVFSSSKGGGNNSEPDGAGGLYV